VLSHAFTQKRQLEKKEFKSSGRVQGLKKKKKIDMGIGSFL